MLHVVLRTCDRHSLNSERIVNKRECIIRCLNSIITNLEQVSDKHLHIIDDGSSQEFIDILKQMVANLPFVSLNMLPIRDQSNLSAKKKTRYSVKVAYDYIYKLPDDHLVYIVEDDYLHLPYSIRNMVVTWQYFSKLLNTNVGIFPQDFNQLYYHPLFKFNETYVTDCTVIPSNDRYYRTTWFTQESFMLESRVFKQYKQEFDSLDKIGDDPAYWEGNTISNVWQKPDVKMFMPLGSLVVHMSAKEDIPFFFNREEVIDLWNHYKTSWSSEQDSQVLL